MADSKITALTSIGTITDPAVDPLVIVDVSDTSMAASGTTKKVTLNNLLACSPTATLASLTVTSSTIPANGLYLPSANSLGFAYNSTLGMTLNSTGLGVGGGPSYKLDVQGTSAGVLRLVNISNLSTDPAAVTRLSLDSQGATWHLDNERTNGIFKITRNSTACLTIDNSANVGIGVTPSAGKGCLQLSSGINFPATQVASSDANTLDDYEEGTFTPTIVGATTAGVGTYSNQNGFYTKVGRLVTITVYLNWTAHTGTGDMRFGNFPFASANVAGNYNGINIAFLNNIALTASNVLYGSIPFGFTYAAALQCPVGGGAASAVPIDTAGEIAFTATYFV